MLTNFPAISGIFIALTFVFTTSTGYFAANPTTVTETKTRFVFGETHIDLAGR